jgi:hypothetical protein
VPACVAEWPVETVGPIEPPDREAKRFQRSDSPAVLLLITLCATSGAQLALASDAITTEQVISHMVEADRERNPKLQGYTSIREYSLKNERFGTTAQMTVRVTYEYPGQKQFEVIAESGSSPIRKRVFHRMLESEVDAARDDVRSQTQITPENYIFKLMGLETLDGRPAFVLQAEPRTKNPLLFRGRIWIDQQDAAISRIEGSPAKSPSFWVKRTTFVHRYRKVGRFWLALSNESETDALIFGHTTVRIEYGDYKITEQETALASH